MATVEGGFDDSMKNHIKSTGMDLRKYKKISSFVETILTNSPNESTLIKEFAKKCYANYPEDDGLRQARKFLRVLFGDNLGVLVKEGCSAALKAAAVSSNNVMRIVRLNKPIKGFHKKLAHYYIGDQLGKGATSVVKLGQNEKTGETVAIKILTGGNFRQEDLKKEIDILKQLDHRNVIKLHDCFDQVDYPQAGQKKGYTTVLVLELATQGEVFDLFMYTGKFEPPLARWFFKQMLEGLDYCHKKGISHRDLKPENCLLGDGHLVKLVDFGFATTFKGEAGKSKMLTALGTPGYAAPEIMLRQKYTESVDIFSLGVILFITIAGFPPFQEAKSDGSDWWFDKLRKKKYSLFWKAHERTAKFSDDAKEIIQGMLAANPKERWTPADIRNCKWWSGKTFSQKEAVAHLEQRKGMVKKEKIRKEADQVDLGKHRAVAGETGAPAMGNFCPQNLFYTIPGVGAKSLRTAIENKITNHFLGSVQKEYQITGTNQKPDLPEELQKKFDALDEKSEERDEILEGWQPWYDLSFKCNLSSEDKKETFPFEASVYIREDTNFKPPADNPEHRRHVVYFTKHRGKAHKWPMLLFHIHAQVGGFFDSDQSDLPKVSPIGGVGMTPAVPADLLDA